MFRVCLNPKLALPLLLGVVALVVWPHAAYAQEPGAKERVIDKRPFDQVVLKGAGKDKLLEVLPLQLAGRRVPTPFPPGRLKVRLVSKPAVEYELNWSDVAAVNLYEQMILAEANKLTQEKKFNDAFEYYAFLNKNYPQSPGLESQVARYLQANALEAFREKQYDHALAILLSLYDRDPRSPGLGRAVDTVADKIIQEYQQAGDWRSRPGGGRRGREAVQGGRSSSGAEVASHFPRDADNLVREGAMALRNEQYREARLAAAAATDILPDHKLAAELRRRAEAQYPAIVVGVRTRAPSDPRCGSTRPSRCGSAGSPAAPSPS